MLVQPLDLYGFINEFSNKNRADRFSTEAKEVLFNYYEELSDDLGEDIHCDIISICCDWYEMSEDELLDSYRIDGFTDIKSIIEYLQDNTFVIELDNNNYLYQVF